MTDAKAAPRDPAEAVDRLEKIEAQAALVRSRQAEEAAAKEAWHDAKAVWEARKLDREEAQDALTRLIEAGQETHPLFEWAEQTGGNGEAVPAATPDAGGASPPAPEEGQAPESFADDGPAYRVFPLPDGLGWTVRNRHGIPWHSCASEAEARAECDRLNAQEEVNGGAREAPLPPESPPADPLCDKCGWPAVPEAPATRIELPLWHLSRLTAILPRGRDGHTEARILAAKAHITTLGELDAYASRGGDLAACGRPEKLLAALGAWWAGHMAGHEAPAWLAGSVPAAAAAPDAPPAEPDPAPAAPGPKRRRKKGGAR